MKNRRTGIIMFFLITLLTACNKAVDFKKNYIGLTRKQIIEECGSIYEHGTNKFGQEFILYEKSKFEGTTFYFDGSNSCIFASIWLSDDDLKNCKAHMDNNVELVKKEGTHGSTYYYYESPALKYRLFDGGDDGGILDMTKPQYEFID